ncbi:L-rhamnose isomerase [Treponema rectale]|uniref:L-rhamnose isomerase n=1 Tax=Treponema rectale TaxID=744512 RepID=A0A840SFB1_9SPIR|nr:L-rhamnose isomerase [Treponema rectale]MBB5218243.1 L-rhamnose isomerase [Treponema rectale]QOS40054.1 L-rhamnose isomerase [Treponema rectale]
MESDYSSAKEQYAALGVDTDRAIQLLKKIPVSMHCWQGDDVGGFEHAGASLDGGGIQVTGNYPGKARSMEELRSDIEKTLSLTPGSYRLNVHANYADFSSTGFADRDALEPEHFKSWVQWSKENKVPLDFNSTLFSHPKASGLTLSSKDKGIRDFWIEHVKRCRKIGEYMGKEQGSACIHNIWIADGMKDIPVDRQGYREILASSLDDILSVKISKDYLKDSVESKVFGIGTESYVVGSHEFYMGYAVKNQMLLTIDMGHFHPTENVADKLSSVLMFVPEILLHLSRGVRWDSDHVTLFNDDMKAMAEEMVRTGKLDKIHIGTDYFDGSINRIGAWVIGQRATQKSLLRALLEPSEKLMSYENDGNYFARLALLEAEKTLPFGAVWNRYCEECSVPSDLQVIDEIMNYEKSVTALRG